MLYPSKQVREELISLKGWKKKGKEIVREFKFRNFVHSIAFVKKVARLAEKSFHHPDILIKYSRVTLYLTTHDEGGLTEKDFNLARQINRLT